ncbi:MAG: cupredoxin domain-containing protein [Thermomicrobiales bacterium]|nr:cupredoxin domain-containing protein [Thermomicrobiales bacterium]
MIVGLVALATLLVVYLANEPNRREAEAAAQQQVAIERGVQTYIQNCVVCHGPAGEGFTEPGAQGTGRVGLPLGGFTEAGLAATERNQSTNPSDVQARHDLIVNTLNNGRGLMPAFGSGAPGGPLLNQEQVNELALMIQHVNWNQVYNATIEADGGFPTPPPAAAPAGGAEKTPPAAAQTAPGEFTITSHDIFFDPKELTIPANQDVVIHLPNEGAAPHNFSIDALKVSVDQAPGETDLSTTINAAPGDYEYYCNVPGHKEAGMVGTLKVVEGAAVPAAAAPAEGGATEAGQAAAQEFTVTSHDIYFDPKDLTIPANQDVTLHLPNEGAAPHNFSIDALQISVDQAPGETDLTATVNAAPGTYDFYCNVPGHKEAGMVGTLTAEEGAAAPVAEAATPAEGAAEAEQAAAPTAAQEFTVTSHDIFFDPKELTIPAGQEVTVHLPNEGAAPHTFSIDALKVSVDQAPGETDVQTSINAPAGTYEYYCNVPGHKEAGMVGTLTAQ